MSRRTWPLTLVAVVAFSSNLWALSGNTRTKGSSLLIAPQDPANPQVPLDIAVGKAVTLDDVLQRVQLQDARGRSLQFSVSSITPIYDEVRRPIAFSDLGEGSELAVKYRPGDGHVLEVNRLRG